MGISEYRYAAQEWDSVFEDTDYAITYRTSTGGEYVRYVRHVLSPKKSKEPELQTGDSAALDAFLGGFANAQK